MALRAPGSRHPTELNPRSSGPEYTLGFHLIRSGDQVMASSAVSFAKENQQRFLGELKALLRTPSVSTTPSHKTDVQKPAESEAKDLRTIGRATGELTPT